MRKMALIGAMIAASSGLISASLALAQRDALDLDLGLLPRRSRGKGQNVRRGKKAPRRHGAKLKPNRLTISKRVRRKHRRAK